jgi:hypothetical protein
MSSLRIDRKNSDKWEAQQRSLPRLTPSVTGITLRLPSVHELDAILYAASKLEFK